MKEHEVNKIIAEFMANKFPDSHLKGVVQYTRSLDALVPVVERLVKQTNMKFYPEISFDKCNGFWRWLVSETVLWDNGIVDVSPSMALATACAKAINELN